MNQYEKRLQDADIEARVSKARAVIDGFSPDLEQEAEGHAPGCLERVQLVLDYTLTRLSLADPMMVTEQVLAQVERQLDVIHTPLSSVASGQVVTALDGTEAPVDALLDALGQIPTTEPASEAITQAAATYRRSLGVRLSGVDEQVDEAKTGLESVKTAQAELKEAHEAATAALDTKVDERLEALGERVTELGTTIDSQKARLDTAISGHQETFAKEQADRTQTFSDLKAELETQAKATESDLLAEAQAILKKLEEHREETEDLVGVIATTGTSHAYGKEANEQGRSADFWRWTALLVGLVAAGIVVWTVAQITAEDASVAVTLAKALASLVFFGIAGYAANQSGLHRRREEDARRRELELVALGPFIASLPEEKQQELREALVAKMFGQATSGIMDGKAALTDDTVTLVGRLIDVVTRASK